VNNTGQEEFIREECNCQATLHYLVNNCLSCGKIICSKEGPGPCYYCGEMVEKGIGYVQPQQSTNKNVVIDEQSDYYNLDDAWLSPEEKAALKEKHENAKKNGNIWLKN